MMITDQKLEISLWEACSMGDIRQVKNLTEAEGGVDLNWKKPEMSVSATSTFLVCSHECHIRFKSTEPEVRKL